TSKLIKTYQTNPEKLTDKQTKAIEKLLSVQKEYIDHIIETEGRKGLVNFNNKVLTWKLENKLITQETFNSQYVKDDSIPSVEGFITNEEKSKYYAATKLEEFVSMSLTDVE